MRVISSAELRNNMNKYLDLAASEEIIIQRGSRETFVLQKKKNISNLTSILTELSAWRNSERVQKNTSEHCLVTNP